MRILVESFRFLTRSMRGRLALLVAAVLLPSAVLASWLIAHGYATARQAVERNLIESARALTWGTDALLREHEARLDGLATSAQLSRSALASFRDQAQSIVRGRGQWFVLADVDGRQVVNTSQPADAVLPNAELSAELLETVRAGRTYISNYTKGPASRQSVVYVARSVVREGMPERVLAAVLSTEEVARALLAPEIGDGWLITLLDRQGRIIARNRDAGTFVGRYASADMSEAISRSIEGVLETVTLDGVESVTAFNRSRHSGWTIVLAAPRSELLASSRVMATVAVLVALVCGGVGLLLAISVGRAVVHAVQVLVLQTNALARGPMPAPVTGIDETDVVARALAEADRLLRAREAELASARDYAVASSRAKDDFLARLSHELRTPLNPVLLEATDAADDPRLPADVRAIFASIARHVQIEARLIDDLLDLTRIERGKLHLELQRVDMHEVARDALASVRGAAAEKRILLQSDLGAATATVRGDPTRLHQVFLNLLNNAIKFTPEGGRVELSTRSAEGHMIVAVADTGIGMSSDEVNRIFQAFAQGDHAQHGGTRYGGLGLGLAISRTLVERHGGSIAAASEGRGQGSTFSVRLPLVAGGEPSGSSATEVRERGGLTSGVGKVQ